MKQKNKVCFPKPTDPLASGLGIELKAYVLKIILLMPEKIQGQPPAEHVECWGAASQEWASSYHDFEL